MRMRKMSEYLIFLLKSIGQRTVVGSFLVAGALGIAGPATAWAADEGALGAVPFEFVGTVANCGIAGSRIVTAAWLRGMGLSDSGGPNDPHSGLLLSKNGTTADCSAAGATVKGVKGMVVTSTFEVGFDYRNGGHCGAGAPRFNIDTDQGFFFVGCANASKIPAPQDPEWTRISSRISACGSECFPGSISAGATINSINIIFDEGTDAANNDTEGVGLAVLDNILINGVFITRPGGN